MDVVEVDESHAILSPANETDAEHKEHCSGNVLKCLRCAFVGGGVRKAVQRASVLKGFHSNIVTSAKAQSLFKQHRNPVLFRQAGKLKSWLTARSPTAGGYWALGCAVCSWASRSQPTRYSNSFANHEVRTVKAAQRCNLVQHSRTKAHQCALAAYIADDPALILETHVVSPSATDAVMCAGDNGAACSSATGAASSTAASSNATGADSSAAGAMSSTASPSAAESPSDAGPKVKSHSVLTFVACWMSVQGRGSAAKTQPLAKGLNLLVADFDKQARGDRHLVPYCLWCLAESRALSCHCSCV